MVFLLLVDSSLQTEQPGCIQLTWFNKDLLPVLLLLSLLVKLGLQIFYAIL